MPTTLEVLLVAVAWFAFVVGLGLLMSANTRKRHPHPKDAAGAERVAR